MPETAINAEEYAKWSQRFSSEILASSNFRSDWMFEVRTKSIVQMVQFLKSDNHMLMDLFGMDYLKYPRASERFAVLYNLYDIKTGRRIHVKVPLPESRPEIDSIVGVYASANWFEREAWDLYGIVFLNHPHLKRILCHDEFVGHALRKDYPATQYQRLNAAVPSTGL